jgi:hypothetical protein
MSQPQIKVRIVEIKYMGWDRLEVAVDVKDPKALYVTYPTVESILNYRSDSVREKIASKSFKAFLGEGRTVGKKSAVIVNKDLRGATAKVNIIPLEELQTLALWECVANQNLDLIRLITVGFIDSLRSIALEQLGVDLGAEERNNWMKARLEGKDERLNFTDAIKEYYLETHPDSDTVPFYAYSNPSDTLNKLLTGFPAKYWRDRFDFTTDEQLRNHWGKKQLNRIEHVEELAKAKVEQGLLEPVAAVRYAIAELGYTVWDEKRLLGKDDPKTQARNWKRAERARKAGNQEGAKRNA